MALNGAPAINFTPAVSFQLPRADQSEIDHYWELLTRAGGEPGQCGWRRDQFGVSWQVVPPLMQRYLGGANADGAQAALRAISKIDLEQLRVADESSNADYTYDDPRPSSHANERLVEPRVHRVRFSAWRLR